MYEHDNRLRGGDRALDPGTGSGYLEGLHLLIEADHFGNGLPPTPSWM